MIMIAKYENIFTGAQPLEGGAGGSWPPHQFLNQNKVQLFQFQTSSILLFMGVQKLYEPEISQFLPCMLQVLENICQHFIFSNYIGEINHLTSEKVRNLTLDLLNSFLFWTIQKKTTIIESLNIRIQAESWTY